MPSSFSTSLRFELQFTGENINLWGEKLSNTLARVDDAIAGYTAIAITGAYSVQSANSNTAADEARRAQLKFTGSLSNNATITLPSVSKPYLIWNATNKALTFSTGAGNTATVEAGDKLPIWCDGTNVNHAVAFGAYTLKEYIAAAVLNASGTLPAVEDNPGTFIYTDGATAFWRQPVATDLADYSTRILGVQVALAVAL
jgi:hypothetical protein